jgi:hypothetical protein
MTRPPVLPPSPSLLRLFALIATPTAIQPTVADVFARTVAPPPHGDGQRQPAAVLTLVRVRLSALAVSTLTPEAHRDAYRALAHALRHEHRQTALRLARELIAEQQGQQAHGRPRRWSSSE